MESLSVCIVAAIVLFYQRLCWSKYTGGVASNKKIMQLVLTYAILAVCVDAFNPDSNPD